MIDIHCHCLPGIDDGPKTWDDSLLLCGALVADGITTVVATPHLIDGVYPNVAPRVAELVAELEARLITANIPLRVLPGAEVAMSCRHLTDDRFDLVPRLAGQPYVLIELPTTLIPPGLETLFFSIARRGVTPVVAHPERYFPVQQNVALAQAWRRAGALLQIDAESVLGLFGPETERTAFRLIHAQLAHALASDSHSSRKRRPRLEAARGVVATRAGEQVATFLTHEGPGRLVAGEPAGDVPPPTVFPEPRRGPVARLWAHARRRYVTSASSTS